MRKEEDKRGRVEKDMYRYLAAMLQTLFYRKGLGTMSIPLRARPCGLSQDILSRALI